MAAIELDYAAHAGRDEGNRARIFQRMWRRWRLLSRLQRRNAHRAVLAMGMDERQLADLGLETRRLRYDWIGQMVRAMSIR